MNNTREYIDKHPLDERTDKGLALFNSSEEAEKATQAFVDRLSQKYPPQTKTRSIRSLLSLAATVLLVLGLWGGIQLQDKTISNDSLTAHHWQFAPMEPMMSAALAPNRDQEEAQTNLEEGRRAYRKGDFESAARALKTYLEQSVSPRPEAILFLGHAQLQYEPTTAIQTLSDFLEESSLDEHYRDMAHWFIAWGYLDINALDQAKAVLLNITDQDSRVYPDAQELLRLLAK